MGKNRDQLEDKISVECAVQKKLKKEIDELSDGELYAEGLEYYGYHFMERERWWHKKDNKVATKLDCFCYSLPKFLPLKGTMMIQ